MNDCYDTQYLTDDVLLFIFGFTPDVTRLMLLSINKFLRSMYSLSNARLALTAMLAARQGSIEILKYLHKALIDDEEMYKSAAKGGHINVIEWMKNEGCRWDEKILLTICTFAIYYDHLKIFLWLDEIGSLPNIGSIETSTDSVEITEWLISKGYKNIDISPCIGKYGDIELYERMKFIGCRSNTLIMWHASQYGQMDLMKYMYNSGCSIPYSVIIYAITKYDTNLLEWLESIGVDMNTCGENCRICSYTQLTKLDSIVFLEKRGHQLGVHDGWMMTAARENIEILKWAHERGHTIGHEKEIMTSAASKGNIEIIRWGVKTFPKKSFTYTSICNEAARYGHFGLFKRYQKRCRRHNPEIALHFAKYGNLDGVKWCIDNGLVEGAMVANICDSATFGGHLNIISYMYSNGYEIPSNICERAINYGRMEIVIWICKTVCGTVREIVHENARDISFFDNNVCVACVKVRNYAALKYCYEHGFTVNDDVLITLVSNDSPISVIEWLLAIIIYKGKEQSDNCYTGKEQSDCEVCGEAVSLGRLNVLQLLTKFGYIPGLISCALARENGHSNILEWMVENGYCECEGTYH